MNNLDIKNNRKAQKYTKKEILSRALWSFGILIFKITPRPFFELRNIILRLFGAKIGRNVHIYSSAIIYMPWNLKIEDWSSIGERALIYNLGKISIGNNATISHNAHLCAGTHDYSDALLPLIKPPVIICDHAWVCADAFVGPGVKIGEGAIVGARAVVVKEVNSWSIVVGNPAKPIGQRKISK